MDRRKSRPICFLFHCRMLRFSMKRLPPLSSFVQRSFPSSVSIPTKNTRINGWTNTKRFRCPPCDLRPPPHSNHTCVRATPAHYRTTITLVSVQPPPTTAQQSHLCPCDPRPSPHNNHTCVRATPAHSRTTITLVSVWPPPTTAQQSHLCPG